MYSLYDSIRLLRNVYKQLVETSLNETGKSLAYVEEEDWGKKGAEFTTFYKEQVEKELTEEEEE